MKSLLIRNISIPGALVLLGLTTATARGEVEDKISKSFTVKAGELLVMNVDRGNIEVKTSDADSVNIEVTRKAKTQQALTDHVVTMGQEGGKVTVQAVYKGPKTSGWGWGNRSVNLQVNYVVTVPRKFDLDLKTAGGHMRVAELTGKLKANTSGGNLDFRKIEGPIDARTSGGHVTLANAKGAVKLSTSGGNLSLSDIEGNVDAHTSGGHIRLKHLAGEIAVDTSGGNIEAREIKGSLDAGTSGGHITTEFLEQPTGACDLNTSGGHVTIVLGEKVAVDIDAHTDGGHTSCDLPFESATGKKNSNVLRGKINGGGPLIKAHTSGGHIRVEKK